jgi:hypothetical protein
MLFNVKMARIGSVEEFDGGNDLERASSLGRGPPN